MGIVADMESKIQSAGSGKHQESHPGLTAGLKYLAEQVEELSKRVAALEREEIREGVPDDHE